jgi:hypothetical protein
MRISEYWRQYQLVNVKVTSKRCKFVIKTEGDPNRWIRYDKFELFKQKELSRDSLLINPSFELNAGPTTSPYGWRVEGSHPSASSVVLEGDKLHLRHLSSSQYQVRTSQVVPGLQKNRTYNLSFASKSIGGIQSSRVIVKDGGSVIVDSPMRSGSQWQTTLIRSIVSATGKISIIFESSESGGNGILVDNLLLY